MSKLQTLDDRTRDFVGSFFELLATCVRRKSERGERDIIAVLRGLGVRVTINYQTAEERYMEIESANDAKVAERRKRKEARAAAKVKDEA